MELGNKILELRKKNNLSQEELAEKMNVARQTISKWELNETSPDINQAKELSKIFNISLDNLTNNDIKNVIEEKINNTEKLAGIIIKILKCLGIAFIIMLVIDVFIFIAFTFFKHEPSNTLNGIVTMNCIIDDNKYEIKVGDKEYLECDNCTQKMNVFLKDITDWANINNSVKNINTYFEENGGSCDKKNG